MMKIESALPWKTVKLDQNLAAKGFSEGLLGIETLTNYNIVKTKGGKTKIKTLDGNAEKKAKRHAKDEEKVKNEPPKKKAKKKEKSCSPKGKYVRAPQLLKTKVENVGSTDVNQEKKDMSAWSDLYVHELILKSLEHQGFTNPTPIQKEILPAAIKGKKDVVGAAETGSGKTLAFAIPILHGILNGDADNFAENEESEEEKDFSDFSDEEASKCVKVVNDVVFDFEEENGDTPFPMLVTDDPPASDKKSLKALILTPTRELAIQIKNHIIAAAKFTDIKVAVVVGGMASQKQTRVLAKGPEIVVATPGRLWDLIQDGNPHLCGVKNVKYLAIDETDRMAEKGHFDELQRLLEMMNECKREDRQTFVFSATMSLVHDVPKHLIGKKKIKKLTSEDKVRGIVEMIGMKENPKIVDLTRKVGTAEGLIESKIHCSIQEKDYYLYYLIVQHPGRTIVFCNSIDCVRRLVNLFGYLRTKPMGLHAQMQQRQRLKNLDRFAKWEDSTLIATDVAARGLDIKNVQHVVHYQVPRTSENYVHRSGRTARAANRGISVMLIEPGENLTYKKMCRTLGRTEDLTEFPIDRQVFPKVKDRVSVARDLDKLLLKSKKADLGKSWFKNAAEEAELEYSDISDSDDEVDRQYKEKEMSRDKAKIHDLKLELDSLLSKPLMQLGFSGKYPTMTGKLELPYHLKPRTNQSAIATLAEGELKNKSVLKKKTGTLS